LAYNELSGGFFDISVGSVATGCVL
jgi:hypothetical protein